MRSHILLVVLFFLTINSYCQNNEVIIKLDDFATLRLVKKPFNKEQRKIIFWDETKETITSIDGKPIYGTDATMPISELTKAELIIGEVRIDLETSGMYDPWYDDYNTVNFELEKFLGNPFRLRCLFSSGAGTYLSEWTIIDNVSYRTMITYDLKILDVIRFNE